MEVLVPTISTLVSAAVPGDNMFVRMHAGALAGEAFRYAINKTSRLSDWIPTFLKTNRLFISQVLADDRRANPVFEQLQEFIIAKHYDHLMDAQLIPKKGEITLYPKQGLKLTEMFQGKRLDISMTYGPSEEGNPDPTKTSYHNQIVLSSRVLKVEQLKEFVQNICKLDRVLHSTIVVYRPLVQHGRREEGNFVEWDKIFMKTNKTLENTIYSDTVVKQLFDDVEWFIQNEEWFKTRGMSYKRGYVLHGPPGIGKCLGRGTPVLMWDGSIKKIEDVVVGDLLVGDDSTPRTVKDLGRGQDQMFKIKQSNASDYIVNSEHILTLHISGNRGIVQNKQRTRPFRVAYFDHVALKTKSKYFKTRGEADSFAEALISISPDTIDIKLKDYQQLDKYTKSRMKGFRVEVNWPETPVEIDPYIVGCWLGDESKNIPLFNNNKHIPSHYKRNCRHVLLRLLAGIIDSNGHKQTNYNCDYEIVQESKTLAEDIQFICQSLGFHCSIHHRQNTCTNSFDGRVKNLYYIIQINGHGLEELPLLCPGKKSSSPPHRDPKKNALMTGITIESLGHDDYFGVVLDGNERFLLGDFTVTHNTSVAKILANKYHLPIFVLDLQSLNSNSDFNKLVTEINYLTDKRYIISIEDLDRTEMFRSKWYGENGKCVSIQCFLNFLDGVVETHGRICIFSANDIRILDDHPSSTAMFRPGRIDCRIEITHCNKTQLSKLFKLYYGEDLPEDSIKITALISPAQFLNIMTKCTKSEVVEYLKSEKGSNISSDADLSIQGLFGEGEKSGGAKRKRCTKRGRSSNYLTPLARIKQKQRELERMEKVIQSSIKKSDKIRESLITRVEKMDEDRTKITQKEETLLSKQKEGFSVVKDSSRGVTLKRSRINK